MKKLSIRRAGALVLALALAMTLTMPAWAADLSDKKIEITGSSTVTAGKDVTLTAEWTEDAPTPSEDGISYTWKITGAGTGVTFDNNQAEKTGTDKTVTVKAAEDASGSVTVSVTATWTEDPGGEKYATSSDFALEVTAASEPPVTDTVPVTGVTLNKKTLSLTVGSSETLTATVAPSNATDKAVTWSSSDPAVASVSGGKVTAQKVGSATITVTTKDGSHTDTCNVTVAAGDITLSFSSASLIDPDTLTVSVSPSGADVSGGTFEWTIEPLGENMTEPTVTGTGRTARVTATQQNAGEYTVKVTYTPAGGGEPKSATIKVTVSGIVLSGTVRVDEDTGAWYMYEGDSATLIVTPYGNATGGTSNVDWLSADSSVISVPNNGGNLMAWAVGKTNITATKGNYSATCTIEVREDESVIADNGGRGYTASTSKPLKFMDADSRLDVGLFDELNAICYDKTQNYLRYITNLEVVKEQGELTGTLYYNYDSEANTGAGVGFTDQFAASAGGALKGLDRLYFVPKQGFSGVAVISFSAVSTGGDNFNGTIKVAVGVTLDKDGNVVGSNEASISYRTRAGEPVWFLTDDFDTYIQSRTGRSMNYVTFSLPQASEGVLYYGYAGGTGTRVATTTQFTQSGRYTVDDVCFVPSATLVTSGETDVTVKFRGVDTSGNVVSGELTVTVTAASSGDDPTNVYAYGEKGQPVTLASNLFNNACRSALDDTLAYVTFKLPDPGEGTLYYNYRSSGIYDHRVTATTRYYYSGVPGLGGVTFVPASDTTDRVAIPYTGYGSGGTSFTGTLYISFDGEDPATIYYSVSKNGSVTFSASDFNTAGLYRMGVGVEYVVFNSVSVAGLGTLRYNYQSSSRTGSAVSSGSSYYVSPSNSQRGLSLISFRANDTAGTVTIPYTAYSSASGTGRTRQSFKGEVVIQVGAVTPADVSLSCANSGFARLSSSSVNSVCGQVMSRGLSYIEITGVPSQEQGHLYLNYYGYGTGTAVEEGDRFYYAGTPSISQLSFVPRAGFSGEVEITYIGYSSYSSDAELEQDQASGRVVVNVTRSTASRYFNDMDSYTWAADSVDYLYLNNTVEGVGGGRYNPAGIMTKGDFTLMLVRAYGLTASGSASFRDVPAGSYYADAIRVASLLGIAGGTNGYYNPTAQITRQDAMVMICNTLKASGITVTNGLAADFSGYHDEKQIANYAREAMGSLMQMGIVQGDGNGYLRPLGLLSRADCAMLLHTIMTL